MNAENGEQIVGYLVFNDYDTALTRAEEEGAACNFPFYQGTGATKHRGYPRQLSNGKWALHINNYSILTEDEKSKIQSNVAFAPAEE
jgi:hypothetical protein|tara:strand:- start:52 stop:312 length:261 start_codon:yes stop_codon:yes gene_type:complete